MRCPMCDRQYKKDANRGHKRRGIGRILAADYNHIISRDGRCLKCGTTDQLTVDHIKPVSLGGSGKLNNLQALCNMCNGVKSAAIADYRSDAVKALYGEHD